jgi:hypothetical protein
MSARERNDQKLFFRLLARATETAALCAMLYALGSSSCRTTQPTEPQDTTKTHVDTTSHNFTWTLDTLGASGWIRDVYIASDTDIWVVGLISLLDSTGHLSDAYNGARWNGRKWEFLRIEFPLCSLDGHIIGSDSPEGVAVFGFGSKDVWLTPNVGGSHVHWDGTHFVQGCVDGKVVGGGMTRLWGTSSTDMYAVGDAACLVHFDGTTWTDIAHGISTYDILDVWGGKNDSTGETEVLAVAGKPLASLDRQIFKLSPLGSVRVADTAIKEPLNAVWFVAGKQYYVAGGGIFWKPRLDAAPWKACSPPASSYYSEGLRGNDTSDIVAVGANGDLVHYNGRSWRSFISQVGIGDGYYARVAMRGNTIVAVGSADNKPIVTRGYRK